MVELDLRVKVLPTRHRIFMVRPGAGYHLLDSLAENEAIAPDLAQLDIPDGERPRDFEGIDVQIKRARALAAWAITQETRDGRLPSLKLRDYSDAEAPGRLAMYRNTADDILHELPEGSLIYLPNPDLTKDGIFGELASPKAPRVRFNGTEHRVGFQYLGRKLMNVKRLPMRRLPKAFISAMKRRI